MVFHASCLLTFDHEYLVIYDKLNSELTLITFKDQVFDKIKIEISYEIDDILLDSFKVVTFCSEKSSKMFDV